MIITKGYALRLIRDGKAGKVCITTDQPYWDARADGQTYHVINRYDLHRTDHFVVDATSDVANATSDVAFLVPVKQNIV